MRQVIGRSERVETVVSRITAKPKIVQLRANIFGVRRFPFEIRRVELDDFITELCHRLECIRQVSTQFTADGVELEADRMFPGCRRFRRRLSRRSSDRHPCGYGSGNRCGNFEKGPPRKGSGIFHKVFWISNGLAIMTPVSLEDQLRHLLIWGSRVTRMFLREEEASMKCTIPCSSLMQRPVWAISMPSAVVETPTMSPVWRRCSAASSLSMGRYFNERAFIFSSASRISPSNSE